jgi:NTE family protein
MSEKKTATVVLGGGSALGLAHIGVLSILEQHFDINAVLGCSIGAIVGALYAMGKSIPEILEIAGRNSNAKVFSPLNLDRRIRGIFDGNYVLKLFQEWTSDALIEDAIIPYLACAYDLKSRSTILFNRGKFADAMRASSSLPLIFAPYYFHNYTFVDGGIEHPLPLSYTHLFKSDLIIAVNVLPIVEHQAKFVEFVDQANPKTKHKFSPEIAWKAVLHNQAYLALKDINEFEPDIVVDAALPGGRPFSFNKSQSFYDHGRKIALKTLEEYSEPSFLDIVRKHYRSLFSSNDTIK